MKLNYDCIRDILLYIEDNTDDEQCTVSAEQLHNSLSQYDTNTLNYHLRKIHSAGLVDDIEYGGGLPSNITWLSWNGHQYLDTIRNDNIWSKTKEVIKPLGSVTLDVISEIATKLIMKSLNL